MNITKSPIVREGNKIRYFIMNDEGDTKLQVVQNDRVTVVNLVLNKDVRRLGRITKSTKTLDVKRVREKHLFIKTNSYGFCEYFLKNQTSFDKIMLFDGHEHWKFPLQLIIDNGKYMQFKQQGFEKQLFISLEELEPYRIKKEENRRL